MKSFDWLQAFERVKHIKENRLAKKTRACYSDKYPLLVSWCFFSKPVVLSNFYRDHFRDYSLESSEAEVVSQAKYLLDNYADQVPLKFESFDSDTFMAWISSLRTKEGKLLSFDAVSGYRSAIYNLLREFKQLNSPYIREYLDEVSEMLLDFEG